MYLKNIAIENIGPISKLAIELPFYENGNPKPLLLVGENGAGKTIFQSQIIDSLYETASNLFTDVGVQNGEARSYYKISGGVNLRSGENKGFSALCFIDSENNKIEYFDKIGNVTKNDFTNAITDFSLSPDDKNGNQKSVINIDDTTKKEKLEKEWIREVHIYQPAYRYEEPFWKSESFIDYQRFEDKRRYSRRLDKEIEIISSTKENKSYLMDLVLDFTNNQANMIDKMIWQNINTILRRIKRKDNIRFGIGPRGGYRVSIVETDEGSNAINQLLPSIDNLSLGESILLNLFINIIRHGDKPPKLTTDIRGIVAIDEIDVHLHTDLQNSVLPELIKLFPKVQFIVTTHSPLFILGMKRVFGEQNFEIRNMPNGEIISAERFSEFENAYKVLKDTEKFEVDFVNKVKELTKPILYVEGDYDIRYIKYIAEKLGKNDILEKIELINGDGSGNLKNLWKIFDSNKAAKISELITNQKILFLFDCDESEDEKDIENKIFKISIPSNVTNLIKIGIENLLSNPVIEEAQKKGYIEYSQTTKKIGENIEILENYSLIKNQKSNLCNWFCNERENSTDDIQAFNVIFDIIESKLLST
jgi:predicted ATPase